MFQACEDSYRAQNAEVDRVLSERDAVEKKSLAFRLANRRNKGTQVRSKLKFSFMINFMIIL